MPDVPLFYFISTILAHRDVFRQIAWQIPIACIQCWDTPDDGQWTCPKHVDYFIKLRISLAFIIRIYHDVRSAECQNGLARNLITILTELPRLILKAFCTRIVSIYYSCCIIHYIEVNRQTLIIFFLFSVCSLCPLLLSYFFPFLSFLQPFFRS